MKVVHLVIGGDVAGGQLVALRLLRAARERGYEVLVVSPSPGPFIDLLQGEGVPVESVDVSRTFHLREAWRLKRLLERERADVLHTHTALAANVLSRVAGRLARVPVVSHMHIENHFRPQRLLRSVHRTLDNVTARLCARVLAVSDDTRRALERQGYPAVRMLTVYNGIDIEGGGTRNGGLRADAGIPADAQVVGSIGRLCAVKGQRELIEALGELRERHSKLWLVLVGSDLEAGGTYRSALEADARRLGVEDRTVFAGYRPDASALLKEMDLFALPSWIEGMPLVVLEAMAHRKPIVATPVGGTPELLEDGRTGVLVPPRDPHRLAQAIDALLTDGARARALGEAAYERAVTRFSADTMVERVLAVYSEVAPNPPRTASDP